VNGRFLADQDIEALFASPLDRTTQTAEIINQYLNLPIQFDDRIMEWDCGDWSGHMYADIADKWPEEWQALQQDRYYYRGPNCENYPDMVDRSTPFLEEIKSHDAETIAIVSHGMIGRVMVSTLLGLNPEETLSFHQGNDQVFHLVLEDDMTHVQHFIGGEGPFPGYAG